VAVTCPRSITQDAENEHQQEHVVTDFIEPSTQHKDQAEWDADSPDEENTEPDVRQLEYEGPNVLERDYA
jgi:hypothetical protein